MLNIFKPIKTIKENLVTIPKKAGQLIFVTDEKSLYIDVSSADTGRIMVSANSFVDVEEADGKTLTFKKADGTSISASITVDDKLNKDSTNAVQNTVVKAAIDGVSNLITNNVTAISNVNTKVDNTNADLATEKTKIAEALADILILQTGVSDLKEKDEELEQKHSNLEKEVTQNQTDIQINKDAILALQQADVELNAKDTTLEQTITTVREEVAAEAERAKNAESALSTRISDHDTRITQNTNTLATLNGTGEGSIDQIAAEKVAELIAGAPDALDSLKEIATWLNTHPTEAVEWHRQLEINTQNIANNASAIDSEEERALNAESALQGLIAEIDTDLAAEIARAKAAEQTNASDIDNLESSRIRDVVVTGKTLTVTKPDGSTEPYTLPDTTYELATTTEPGLMSPEDKSKIAAFPQVVFCTQTQYDALGSVTATDGKIYFIKKEPTIEDSLIDFDYIKNADGTYTLTGWKQTLNEVASTEMVIPDSDKIIIEVE